MCVMSALGSARQLYMYYRLVNNMGPKATGHVALVANSGATKQFANHLSKLLQLILKTNTSKFHLLIYLCGQYRVCWWCGTYYI